MPLRSVRTARPGAAESLGVRVVAARWAALGVCGLLAGLGGGLLSLASVGFFTDNGRGFIALAAVIFGRWRIFPTAGAVLLFALADAFQIRRQAIGVVDIPPQFLVMLPYVVTLVALAAAHPSDAPSERARRELRIELAPSLGRRES